MAEYIDRKDVITADLKACNQAFAAARVPWCIMGGIVLGYARYKDIMRWDTDVDMGVFVELTPQEWQKLNHSLRRYGFGIPLQKNDFVYCFRKAEFNMWMFHKNGDYYESFPASTPGIKFVEKAIWYDEPQIVDFLGGKYPMPNSMDDYLVCQYGKNWETNIIKNHEQYYLEKRGTRDTGQWPAGRATKEGDMWPKTLKVEDSM